MRKTLLLSSLIATGGLAFAGPVAIQQSKPLPSLPAGVAGDIRTTSHSVNPCRVSADDYRLNESFEKDDMSDFTLPDGWAKVVDNDMQWIPYFMGRLGMASFDGLYAAMANCWELHDEAWLISPEIVVAEGDELSYALYFDVRSLYVWKAPYVDDEDGLILDRVNAENIRLCISVDGGEWIELDNLWKTYGDMGYHEIIDDYPTPEFRKFKIDLSEYAGKKVKIGWCHSYTDENGGHGMFLDAVKVSAPQLEAGYDLPLSMTFMGLTSDMSYMPGFGFVPYYTPVIWEPNVWGEDYNYAWSVVDLDGETIGTGSGDEYSTLVTPDYSVAEDANYTMSYFPTIEVSKEGATPGIYTYGDGYAYLFGGGRPAMATRDGGEINFGLTSFDPADGVYTVNADFDTPAWGYNAMTQRWWTDHYMRGEAEADDVVKIINNLNVFMTAGSPMVIDGVTVLGMGRFDDDVEFKMEIVRLGDDFVPADTAVATATLTGAEVTKDSETDYPYDVCAFEFKFDQPIVVDYNMVTRFSGFDNDKVEFFAPFQSALPVNSCHGFATQSIYAPSIGGEKVYENMIGIYVIDGGYGDAMNSFAHVLDATYPYLHGTDNEFSATEAGQQKVITLDSWYDAADLKVSVANAEGDEALPSWLKIEKQGRFGKTEITITADGVVPGDSDQCDILLSAPGVSYNIHVSQTATAGLNAISTDGTVITGIYDLTGRSLNAIPASGAYIVKKRDASGNTTTQKYIR